MTSVAPLNMEARAEEAAETSIPQRFVTGSSKRSIVADRESERERERSSDVIWG